jgi:outer membrane protein OmpA-like peptidoglycan-associated protein
MTKGTVYDKETSQPLPLATIQVSDADGKVLLSLKTSENGTFLAELPLDQNMLVVAQKEKYFASVPLSASSVGVFKDSTIQFTFTLDPIPTEDYEFTLQGIYYDLDKFNIRPDAARVLDSLVSILQLNPTITLELGSHTDSRAAEDYNLKLSQKRAESCVEYLTKKGIDKNRLTPVGYGETHLVNDCADGVDCTEEEQQQNRRTTIRVLTSDYKIKRR